MSDTNLKVIDEGLRTLLFVKFGTIFGLDSLEDDLVMLYPKAIALRKAAEKYDKSSLEFINFIRTETNVDWSRQRTPLARRGIYLGYTNDATREDIVTVYAVPVSLRYDIWFWSKDREIVNAAAEEYLFWQQRDPNLDLRYNNEWELEYDLHFGDITDESTYEEMYDIGIMHVYHAPITVDGWVFKGYEAKSIKKIVITIWDRDEIESITEFLASPDEGLKVAEFEEEFTI